MHEIAADIRYACRILRKSPGFTTAAMATLTLSLGAIIAMFSIIHAVLLRPLLYKDPDRLVHVLADHPDDPRSGVAYNSYELWRIANHSFENLAVYYRDTGWSRVTLPHEAGPESVQAGFVSASFFSVLGVSPSGGRTFLNWEERQHLPLAVLSDGLWRRYFGGSPNAMGQPITIDGRAFTVIGVMPAEFHFPARDIQLWLPITTNRYWTERLVADDIHSRGYFMRWNVVARLRTNVDRSRATRELETLSDRIAAEDPDWNLGLPLRVVPLDNEVDSSQRSALWVLFGAVALVLLIGCTNVANLMLAQGAGRARELAMRTALGASKLRIARQILTESCVLVFASVALAVPIAALAIRCFIQFDPTDLPRMNETRIDGVVLCFGASMALLTAFLFGLIPAVRATWTEPREVLQSAALSISGRSRTGGILMSSEIALATVVLSAAGLLIRSLDAIDRLDPGFQPDHVLTLNLRLPAGTSETRQADFQRQLELRLKGVRNIRFVGGIRGLFELGRPPSNSLRAVEGRPPDGGMTAPLTWNTVSGNYFQAMGIRLLSGRYFSNRDTATSPLVAIIDDAMAKRYWPDENALGQRFKGQDRRGQNDDWLTVIGVVRNSRRQGLEQDPTPHVYEWSEQAGPITDCVIRTTSDPAQLAGTVRQAVREIDPSAVLMNVATLTDRIALQTAPRRFRTWLLSLFAAIALLLSGVGIYGVISYATQRRTREIGIRMALGADPGAVLMLIFRQGIRWIVAGILAGTMGALAATRLMAGLLFGWCPLIR